MKRATRHGAMNSGSRSVLLDALRGVAILLVLGCHHVIPPEEAGTLSSLAGGWAHVGWSGVDLFFVLSGYLVSGLLFAEYARNKTVDLQRFAVRRAFKIWPSYAVYLCVVLVWLIYKSDWAAAFDSLWPNLLHAQNYFGTPRVHTWSLAVEEHFYLIVAIASTWLVRRRTPSVASLRVVGLLVLGMLAVSVSRHLAFIRSGSGMNIYATHLRCDGLLVGTILAHFSHFRPHALACFSVRPFTTMIAGASLAAPVIILTPDHSAWMAGLGLSALYIGIALIIQGLLAAQNSPWMSWSLRLAPVRWMAWVGVFSYGIYLWHVELGQTPFKKLAELEILSAAAEASWVLLTCGYVTAAVLGGAAMSKLIEFPALKLRDRLFPAKTDISTILPRQLSEADWPTVSRPTATPAPAAARP